MIFRLILSLTLFVACWSYGVLGANQADLVAAFEQMHDPELDSNAAYFVCNNQIVHHDFRLTVDSGILIMFRPLRIDGEPRHWGAYIRGNATFDFRPTLKMEKTQLRRFYGVDSLIQTCSEAMLYFDERVAKSLLVGAKPMKIKPASEMARNVSRSHDLLLHGDEHYYLFEILRNVAYPAAERFLLVNAMLTEGPTTYLFNPYAREEVQLLRPASGASGGDELELVNQYSMYTDDRYFMLNGLVKPVIRPSHYDLHLEMDDKFAVAGDATLQCVVDCPTTQLIPFTLDKRLTVDSVLIGRTQVVAIRYEDHSVASRGLYLILEKPITFGDSVAIRFYYHGELGERMTGESWVDAAAEWYPRYGYSEQTTFDLHFVTPSKYQLVASGARVTMVTTGDTIISVWRISQPTAYASFNIGNFDSTSAGSGESPKVTVYCNDRMRAAMFGALEEHPGLQVAEEIAVDMEYFSSLFGSYNLPELAVTEIPVWRGRSYAGLIHLGSHTFLGDDEYGYLRLFRAHEVAHQWWGTGVGFESYRDQWLSEGFAEYSALLFLEATSGEKAFQHWLEQYRDDIFDKCDEIKSKGRDVSPVALGYRTSSSRAAGEYDLLVYRKGAYVLHMIRSLLRDWQNDDDSRFIALMREFYRRYNGGRASTRDFQWLVEKYAGIDMTWFFQEWVYGSDLPTYRIESKIEVTESGRWTVTCTISQRQVPSGFTMWVPLAIRFEDDTVRYFLVLIDREQIQYHLPEFTQAPKEITLNPYGSVLAKVEGQ